MTHKVGLTLVSALVLAIAGTFGSVSESVAQTVQNPSESVTDMSAQERHQQKGSPARSAAPRGPARVTGPRTVSPRTAVPRTAGPRTVSPRTVTPRTVSPRTVGPRTVSPRTVGPRTVSPRTVGPRTVSPRTVGPRTVGPRVVAPPARALRGVSIRGANRAAIAGRNYSIWRGSHRVRRSGQWRTFVALSALGSLAIGAATYYPYAYIDAPAPYCEGLTEDGCQLRWLAVRTLEGPVEFQCVAYCPWQ
jgi:hypothetical protein